LVISPLLPKSVIQSPLIATYLEWSANADAYVAWEATLLAVQHGSPREGAVAFARFLAGPGAGEWPISAEETVRLFELDAHLHQEAILAHGRKLVAEPPTNQSVRWASLLVRYGTEKDRQATVAKLMADLAGSDDDRLSRALSELSQTPEFVDRQEIGTRLKALIKRLGHPHESTRGYNLQTGAVRLWG
jgi:hypothetical protein